MFIVSKIVGLLTDPLFLFGLAFMGAVYAVRRGSPKARERGVKTLVLLATLWFVSMFVPFGAWALLPLENAYAKIDLPDQIDGIVMLTGDENPRQSEMRGVPSTGLATMRYIHLARMASRYPQAKIVIAGSTDAHHKPQRITTRDVSSSVVNTLGIDPARVTYEQESRTTYENALKTFELVKPDKAEKWVLITSAFHMPRSVMCFRKEGWDVIPSPSDYFTDGDVRILTYPFQTPANLRMLSIAAHEYYGIVSYWLMGWIGSPWH